MVVLVHACQNVLIGHKDHLIELFRAENWGEHESFRELGGPHNEVEGSNLVIHVKRDIQLGVCGDLTGKVFPLVVLIAD